MTTSAKTVALAAGALCALANPGFAAGCGAESTPCLTEQGQYHSVLPEQPDGAPVVIFLHGAGGSGAGVLRSAAQADDLTARGFAVLAPDGSRRFGGGLSWNFYPDWDGRDETAFLDEVAQDAAQRFGLDADRVILAGFSAGAFQVTYSACSDPDLFAAYAPVAGGFWVPLPAECKGPVALYQSHGWRDGVVPLEGRPLGGGRFLQGDIYAGLDIWRRANACADPKPDHMSVAGQVWHRNWQDCAPNSALHFELTPGGHSVPAGWAGRVVDWFDGLTLPE